ncbi:MAG: glycoside hydrolase family 3 N-terminal domain-containing protein, partial [Anaerolineales bacterium]
PEERIGQLVLVTFEGSAPEADDAIFELIQNQHISGVVLSAENDNFVDAPDTLEQARTLISTLQEAELAGSTQATLTDPETGEQRNPVYVPLFVAISQEEGGAQYREIISGLTELPSEMALGATWDPELAQAVGEIQGRELQTIGINMLFGPALDVVEDPRLGGTALGVGVFGGDPFWVSVMGEAYVEGLHQGSDGRLAVIVKHFAGLGSSDRPQELEVATIRKSLAQLKQIDLAPFFAVTGMVTEEDLSVADGLLTSHIRYQGFQGNIRATTRPVSLDQQAFSALMALEELAAWREEGGVTVCDSLGSRAVRRFYDPLENSFSGHLVARDAFLAGNDLLVLSDFQGTADDDEASTIRAMLAFFAQKYQDDAVFAQRVDEAVLRILGLKLRLFGDPFRLSRVMPSAYGWRAIGNETEITYEVAQKAATLISPSYEELASAIEEPPGLGEQVVFFTDVRFTRQCSTCGERAIMEVNELENTVVRLYGTRAAGQVGEWTLSSFRMADLSYYLGKELPEQPGIIMRSPDDVAEALRTADWLVFSVLRISGDVYGSDALKMLLDQRPDIARSKRVIVFTFDVPYELDATDLSKVDAHFSLYGSSPAFVDVAARLLFQELAATGAAPVSIPGIGYDLIEVLAPDAEQVIPLRIVGEEEGAEAEEVPSGYAVGDVIVIEAGVIKDTNGHPVPDGTPVVFNVSYQGEGMIAITLDAMTIGGMARASLTLDRVGLMQVEAASDPARASELIQLNVQEGAPGEMASTPPAEETEVGAEATAGPSEGIEGTTPEAEEPDDGVQIKSKVDFIDLLAGIAGITMAAGVYVAVGRRESGDAKSLIRPLLCGALGGLVAYNYLALGLPGASTLLQTMGVVASLAITAVGAGVGLVGAHAWLQRRQKA